MIRWLRLHWTLWALALCGACSGEEKGSLAQIAVVVDADATLRAVLDTVVFESDKGARTFVIDGPNTDENSVRFPFSRIVYANPQELRGKLRVRGFAGAKEIVRFTGELELDDGKVPVWGVYLAAACTNVFKTCDEANRGTCAPCTGQCVSASVSAADLPRQSDSKDALKLWQAPSCNEGTDVDAGGNGSTPGEGGTEPDGSTFPGDGSVPTDGMAPSSELLIAGPGVIAAPGCMPFTVTRAKAGGKAKLSLSALPVQAAFFGDAACSMPVPAQFGADQRELEVFVKPSLPDDELVTTVMLNAASEGKEATKALEIRMRARQIVRGDDLLCALLENGRIHCAGYDSHGRLGHPTVTLGVQQLPLEGTAIQGAFPKDSRLDSRYTFVCGIALDSPSDTEGKVRCWGDNGYGQVTSGAWTSGEALTPEGLPGDFKSVATGVWHACALNSASELWCWGRNTNKQIADDNVDPKPPTRIDALNPLLDEGETITQVAPGYHVTCASTSLHNVYCWGAGYDSGPARINFKAGIAIKNIGAYGFGACIVTTEDKVYCVEDPSTVTQVTFPLDTPIEAFRSSFRSTCAGNESDLYCWGNNAQGWLATGSQSTSISVPERVQLPPGKLESFALGGYEATLLSAVVDGLVYSWGYALGDTGGSLGIDLNLEDYPLPVIHPRLQDATSVHTMGINACMLNASGGVSCWGEGAMLGSGAGELLEGGFSAVPVPVTGLGSGVTQLEMNKGAVIASTANSVWAWGNGIGGSLGDETTQAHAEPFELSFGETGDVLAIGATDYRACALIDTHQTSTPRHVYCWGNFPRTPPADPLVDPPARPFLAFSGDETLTDMDVNAWDRACVLIGTEVRCWAGKPAVPSTLLTDVKAFDMGGILSCAQKTDDSLVCSSSSAPFTQAFASVSSFKVGENHACAILKGGPNAGQLWCLGTNYHGQLGTGEVADASFPAARVENLVGTIQSYSLGDDTSCAHDDEGVKCWGSNQNNAISFSETLVDRPTLIAPWQKP